MQLDHEFTVPVPVAQAWPILLDVERIAPCMPGATVTKVDGDNVEGTVKVKVGPITVTYSGSATFLEKDGVARRVVIEARGRETRGSGTASARVTAQLYDEGDRTRVTVSTDLSITGKPAQFGRGVMSDVGAKLLGQFADCLSRELAASESATGSAATSAVPAAAHAQSVASAPATGAATPGGSADAGGSADTGGSAGAGGAGAAGGGAGGAASGATGPASVLDASGAAQPTSSTDGSTGTRAGVAQRARPSAEAIDLLDAAGGAVLKRVVPALAAVAALLAAVAFVLRRRSQR